MPVIINKSFKVNNRAFEGDLDRFLVIPENHEELVKKSELYRDAKYPVRVSRPLLLDAWSGH